MAWYPSYDSDQQLVSVLPTAAYAHVALGTSAMRQLLMKCRESSTSVQLDVSGPQMTNVSSNVQLHSPQG